MKDIKVEVHSDSTVYVYENILGYNGENNAGRIVIEMEQFIDGIGILEIEQGDNKYFVELYKENETYYLPVKNILLLTKEISFQLRITSNKDTIYKSEIFKLNVEDSINSIGEVPEEYPTWIDVANAKILEMNTLMNDLEEKVETGYFNGEQGSQGEPGQAGKDATINGMNVAEIVAGENITIESKDNQIIINGESGSAYDDTEIKKEISDLKIEVDKTLINVTYNGSNGILSFEKETGDIINIDLPLELLVSSGTYDSANKQIVLVLANGDEIRIDASDLVDEYYADNTTIELKDIDGKMTFNVKDGVFAKKEEIPTKTSQLENNSNFLTEIPDSYATKEYVDNSIGSINTILATLTTVSEVSE